MKTKVLALILTLLMLLTLCACGSSKASSVEAPMEEAMEMVNLTGLGSRRPYENFSTVSNMDFKR